MHAMPCRHFKNGKKAIKYCTQCCAGSIQSQIMARTWSVFIIRHLNPPDILLKAITMYLLTCNNILRIAMCLQTLEKFEHCVQRRRAYIPHRHLQTMYLLTQRKQPCHCYCGRAAHINVLFPSSTHALQLRRDKAVRIGKNLNQISGTGLCPKINYMEAGHVHIVQCTLLHKAPQGPQGIFFLPWCLYIHQDSQYLFNILW